ncbi:hypothetical protein Taro_025769, partial [Colocasia esculenta]|nr:hypothetical protein [Colocasia esculenta]
MKEDLVVSRVLFPSVVKEDLVSSRLIFKDPFTPPLGSSTGQQVVSERVSSTKKGSNDLKSKDPWQPKRILAKKKKFQSGGRHFKRNKDFKKPDGKEMKKGEPICYDCKKPGHIKAECPKFKKPEFRKKDSSKKFRKYKKKAMAAAWENSSGSDSESSSCSDEEKANLAFMANTEDK